MNLSKNLNELHVVIIHNFAIVEHKHNNGGGNGKCRKCYFVSFNAKIALHALLILCKLTLGTH